MAHIKCNKCKTEFPEGDYYGFICPQCGTDSRANTSMTSTSQKLPTDVPPTAAEEKAGYKLLPNGSKHYLRANAFDYIACIILPGFGLIYGAYAYFKRDEKKRGMTMMVLGGFINLCMLVSSLNNR